MTRRDYTSIYSIAAEGSRGDQRPQAPGIRGRHPHSESSWSGSQWIEGNGRAPLGWEPWDYEQEIGYRTFAMRGEYPWAHEHPHWDLDEILGVRPPDLTDEMEDWDLGPMRTRYARDWDFTPPPAPFPKVNRNEVIDDPYAVAYEHDRKTEARRQRIEDEEKERRKAVNEERRNITAMKRAAREKVLERVKEGVEGKYEVRVRKSNQTLVWEYEIRNGKAYVHLKRTGWVRLAERRM